MIDFLTETIKNSQKCDSFSSLALIKELFLKVDLVQKRDNNHIEGGENFKKTNTSIE